MLLVIILIIIVIWYFHKAYSPQTKPDDYYLRTPEVHGTYVVHCKQLTGWQSMMNLGMNNSGDALEYFAYNDMHLVLRFKNGCTYSGTIDTMEAEYDIYKGDNVQCTLRWAGNKVKIFTIAYLFDDNEWYDMLNILTHCKTTKNVKAYLKLERRNRG